MTEEFKTTVPIIKIHLHLQAYFHSFFPIITYVLFCASRMGKLISDISDIFLIYLNWNFAGHIFIIFSLT